MKINKFRSVKISYCWLILLLLSISCGSDDENSIREESLTELEINENINLTAIPLEIVKINIPNLPGQQDEYQVLLNDFQLPIYNLTLESFEFMVPIDISFDEISILLNYKNHNYEIGKIKVADPSEIFESGFVIHETENENYPLLMLDSINNLFSTHVVDGQVQGISIQEVNGLNSYIEVDGNFLPKMLYAENFKILFDGYDLEANTVDIAYFEDDLLHEPIYQYDIPINEQIIGLLQSSMSRQQNKIGQTSNGELKLALTIALGIAECTVSAIATITGVIPLAAATAIGCASTIYTVLILEYPELENELVNKLVAYYSWKLSSLGCLTPSLPTPLIVIEKTVACTNLILDSSEALYNLYKNYKNSNQENINELYNNLNFQNSFELSPEIIDYSGVTFYPFRSYFGNFYVKNKSNSLIEISSVSTPDFIVMGITNNSVTISQGNQRAFGFGIRSQSLGNKSGSIQLFTSNNQIISISLENILISGLPKERFYGGNQINSDRGGLILGFLEDGSVSYSCTEGGSSNVRCESDGSWSFDGFNLAFDITVTMTWDSYSEENERSSRNWSYSYSGQLASQTFCLGTLNYSDSDNNSWSSDSRVTFD